MGTVGFPHDPEALGARGTFHAVRIAEAAAGMALCGAHVQAWVTLSFPAPERPTECEICRFAADNEPGPAAAA